jgi:hypothetical protein
MLPTDILFLKGVDLGINIRTCLLVLYTSQNRNYLTSIKKRHSYLSNLNNPIPIRTSASNKTSRSSLLPYMKCRRLFEISGVRQLADEDVKLQSNIEIGVFLEAITINQQL